MNPIPPPRALNRLADLVRLRAFADLVVQPVGRAAATTLGNLGLGAQVTAQIQIARADGTVRATIDGEPFELRLPFNARAGESIALRVAAREPQLRFTLEPDAETTPQLPRLSETARFITALLAESEKLPLTAQKVVGPPLLDGPPQNSSAIAHALRNALADSGMFYEAHQAQWAVDKRSFAALLREPQARLRPLPAENTPGLLTSDLPPLKELPVHRDALTVVRQQLETLETRQLVWQGTLWPGQTIEWQVGEAPAHAAGDDGDGHEWQSRVQIALPRLGAIDATLVVSARGVRVHLRADTHDAATLLDANRQSLQRALADAGVPPLAIGVVHAGA